MHLNENKNLLLRIIGLVLVIAVIATAIGAVSAASDIYVSTNGNDGNSGLNFSTSKATINSSVEAAENNSKIILKNGTYSGSNNTNITISKNLTIIGESTGKVIIDGSSFAKMFIITKGNTLTLINITFMNGFGVNGGAIYNDGTLNIQDCIFINNIATSNGGAIYTNNGELNIYETCFVNNDAANGGALFVQNSVGVANYNSFENNSNYDLYYSGSFENFNADYNYWGKNVPTVSGILLNNYFVIEIVEKVDDIYTDTPTSDDVNTDVSTDNILDNRNNDDNTRSDNEQSEEVTSLLIIDNKIIRLNTNEDFAIVKLFKIANTHTVIIPAVDNSGFDSTAIIGDSDNNSDKGTIEITVGDVQGQNKNINITFNNETYIATVTDNSNGQVTVEIDVSDEEIAIFLNDLIGANAISDVLYREISNFNTHVRIAIVSSNKNKIMVTFDDYLVDFEEIAIYINGQLFGNSVVNNNGIEFEYNIDIINDIIDTNNYNNNYNNNQNTLETDDPVDQVEEELTLETDDLVENDDSDLSQVAEEQTEEIVIDDVEGVSDLPSSRGILREGSGISPRSGISALAAIAPLAAVAGASTLYVSPSGNDNNAGTSTAAPLKTINAALNAIAAGGTIYLMSGTHTAGFTVGGVTISKNVNIIGYSGTVILNANGLGRHFTITGPYTVKFQNIRLINGMVPQSTVAGSI
ncbi:MAG: hypothetical protein LBM26_00610, partial [Methanobrevibacter sp.]|nr:hypothetical protein [Methanobrevibacter sp.]